MILSGRAVAIVGSRKYQNKEAVIQFVDRLPLDCTVVSGACPDSPDTWAVERAKERGIATKEYPAQWRQGGLFDKSAGFRRNATVVDASDIVVAFWDGESAGTKGTIELAHRRRRSVMVIGPDGVLAKAA